MRHKWKKTKETDKEICLNCNLKKINLGKPIGYIYTHEENDLNIFNKYFIYAGKCLQ